MNQPGCAWPGASQQAGSCEDRLTCNYQCPCGRLIRHGQIQDRPVLIATGLLITEPIDNTESHGQSENLVSLRYPGAFLNKAGGPNNNMKAMCAARKEVNNQTSTRSVQGSTPTCALMAQITPSATLDRNAYQGRLWRQVSSYDDGWSSSLMDGPLLLGRKPTLDRWRWSTSWGSAATNLLVCATGEIHDGCN